MHCNFKRLRNLQLHGSQCSVVVSIPLYRGHLWSLLGTRVVTRIWYVDCDRHHHNCRYCYQPHYRVQVNNAIGLTIVAVNYVINRSSIRCHPCIYHSWEHYGMLGIVSSTVLFKAEINTTWYISLDICTHMYSKTTPNRCALKLARSKSHTSISVMFWTPPAR